MSLGKNSVTLNKENKFFEVLVKVYRYGISPLIHTILGPGNGCRFRPTCSEYAEEQIRILGWKRGSLKAMRRILRCHPFSRESKIED